MQDDTGPATVELEAQVKVKTKSLDDQGDDFEKTAKGYVDYLLLDARGFPIAALEAKSETFDPLVGKEQVRKYAHSQNVRFVILSNGNLNYSWDLEQGNPVLITELPTPESLENFHTFQPNPDTLVREQVERDYVAVTQNPNYASDPRGKPDLQGSGISEGKAGYARRTEAPNLPASRNGRLTNQDVRKKLRGTTAVKPPGRQ